MSHDLNQNCFPFRYLRLWLAFVMNKCGLVRIYGYLQQFAFSYIVSVDFVNNNFILQSGTLSWKKIGSKTIGCGFRTITNKLLPVRHDVV